MGKAKEKTQKLQGSSMRKNDYIMLINDELKQLDNEYYLRIIYLLVRKYREEGS